MKNLKNAKILSKKEQQSIDGGNTSSACMGNPCGEGEVCSNGRCIGLMSFKSLL